jgi:isopenicillin N synthase-like dioxygenase
MTLPLVDLAGTFDAGACIDAGLSTFGFLRLANIGIDPDLLEEVFQASASFFRRTPEAKRQYLYRSAVENFGY